MEQQGGRGEAAGAAGVGGGGGGGAADAAGWVGGVHLAGVLVLEGEAAAGGRADGRRFNNL